MSKITYNLKASLPSFKLTSISMPHCIYSFNFFIISIRNFPFSATIKLPILILIFLINYLSDFPIPIAILLIGSSQQQLFLLREFAIEKATFCCRELSVNNIYRYKFFSPFSSTTICFAKFKHNF